MEFGRVGRRLGFPRPAIGWADLAVALAVGVIQVVGSHFAAKGQSGRLAPDLFANSVLVLSASALIFRRRFPTAVLLTVVGLTLTYLLGGYAYGPSMLSAIVAFFTTIIDGRRLLGWAATATLYFGHVGGRWLLGLDSGPSLAQAIGTFAWLVLMLLGFEVVRARREQLMQKAKTREEETLRRAGEERLRIARELHDVLAHNISLISIQAGVGLHLMDEQPEQARASLTAIREASKDALSELRSVLGILRGTDEAAPLTPAPDLRRLDDLVSGARAAGVRVETEIDGTRPEMAAGVELAAFRIVQEALTNVCRHASAAKAVVRVRYGEDEVTVQVDDDGRGANPSAEGGNGINGMRERAAALGGDLEAGPKPGGGFRVLARLPLHGAR